MSNEEDNNPFVKFMKSLDDKKAESLVQEQGTKKKSKNNDAEIIHLAFALTEGMETASSIEAEYEPKSRYDRLEEIVHDLDHACQRIKMALQATSSSPSAMLLQSYQKMLNEYRLAVNELDAIQQPEDVVSDIVEKVLNPIIMDLVQTCTEELSKAQDELTSLGVSERDAKGLSNDLFIRLTDRMKNSVTVAVSNLNKYLGVKEDKDINTINRSSL